ncbi:Alpha-galactosidase [Coccomyxa sp. Obi]|nr:Alpha-galactosidase [Coccomyxa sp. Obi]
MCLNIVCICITLLALFLQALCLDNGLARTPALGYNTWNAYGGDINEDLIRATADLMISTGLKKAGYHYLVIDDAWSNLQRDDEGRLQSNSDRFPSGMKALADYVHSKGLKFGMYSDAGSHTCLGYPGSRYHEEEDAQTFADWGVDFLKYDNCWAPASDWVIDRYTAMHAALNKTGRPILYSMCDWGVGDPWLWAPKIANSWRTTGDISPNWESMLRCLDNTIGLSEFAKPGAWNDPDMLEVGNPGLTEQEQRSNFAVWAILKSPLIVGTDLRRLSKAALNILTAEEVIAVNQDKLGVAGDLIWKRGPTEVYAGPLEDGSRAVVLFNRHTSGTQYPLSNITVQWQDLGFEGELDATVRDLFAEKDLGTFSGSWTGVVGLHDVRMVKISPIKSASHYKDWRPWLQHSALHAAERMDRQISMPQPEGLPGRPIKVARYQEMKELVGNVQVS